MHAMIAPVLRLLIPGTLTAGLLHITPTVVLTPRRDAAATLLPGAELVVAREIRDPSGRVLTFYVGKHGESEVGVLQFVQVDGSNGPVEVAVGFAADGTIRGVVVTKVTMETKPWILTALKAGLTDHYRGLTPGDVPAAAEALRGSVGSMPAHMAQQVDKGVARALALYGAIHRQHAS